MVTGADVLPPRRRFAERLRRARSKRNEDWWSIVLGGPVAQVATALVGDVAWITPNRLTWLSFATKLAVAPLLLVHGTAAAVVAIALMQVNVVLDSMDGVLARYRGAASAFGAFLDKITDAIGLAAVMGAFAARVLDDTGDGWACAVVAAGGALWIVRVYAYWVLAWLERDAQVAAPSAGGERRRDFGDLGFAARLRYYAASTWRIALCAEADAYCWLAVALATGWLRPVAYGYGGGLAAWSVALLVARGRRAAAIDRARARPPSPGRGAA